MKLLNCLYCHDFVRLDMDIRKCKCGKSSGRYINNHEVEIEGNARIIGILNASYINSILDGNPDGNFLMAFSFPAHDRGKRLDNRIMYDVDREQLLSFIYPDVHQRLVFGREREDETIKLP